MDAMQWLFQAAIGLLGVLISYYVYTTREDMKAMKDSNDKQHAAATSNHTTLLERIGRTEAHIAGQYVTRTELDQRMNRIEDTINSGFERMYDKLDGKVDK